MTSPTYRYLDSLYYYLGRLQEGQGNKDAAKKPYEKFLTLKSKADQGHALVSDARRRIKNL